jgi:hypothetical protein
MRPDRENSNPALFSKAPAKSQKKQTEISNSETRIESSTFLVILGVTAWVSRAQRLFEAVSNSARPTGFDKASVFAPSIG